MKHPIKSILLATAVSFGTVCAQAAASGKTNFIVQALSTNPEFAQNPSQDLLLHDGDNGSTYLYVEQQQGAILAIFDVSDPGHMKIVKFVHTQARGAYDFVTPIGGSTELISLGASGYLSLRHDASPAASAPLRDIQLIETDQTPRLLTTITSVTKQTARADTGTIFLLSDGKIVVIRCMDAERQYAFQQALSKN